MATTTKNYNFVNLINDIKLKNLTSTYETAIRTEEILERIISDGEWTTAQELMQLIKAQLDVYSKVLPLDVTASNIMRHVLKVIRDEYDSGFKSKSDGLQSLHHLVTSDSDITGDYSKKLDTLKLSLLDQLSEYKGELERSTDNIASQACEHIHSNEIILTFGMSRTVEKFLKSAAKTRKFQVIVVEAAPSCSGRLMAASLVKSNIQTTFIPDTAIFAIMSRVNKVIIGVHSVMANGGLRTLSGGHAVALSAKHYSVPVMVLTHMYKLTPLYVSSSQQQTFNINLNPADILPDATGALLNKVEVYCPMFDYIPPELVTLFISHIGGNAPSYIYRLLTELYHPDDYE